MLIKLVTKSAETMKQIDCSTNNILLDQRKYIKVLLPSTNLESLVRARCLVNCPKLSGS